MRHHSVKTGQRKTIWQSPRVWGWASWSATSQWPSQDSRCPDWTSWDNAYLEDVWVKMGQVSLQAVCLSGLAMLRFYQWWRWNFPNHYNHNLQFHELACSSMKFHISLSEQLTRTSQCLLSSDWDWDWGWGCESSPRRWQYNARGHPYTRLLTHHIPDCSPPNF